jgi:hypothetical protein
MVRDRCLGFRSCAKRIGKVDLNIALGLGGWIALIAGALIFALGAQRITGTPRGLEFVVVAFAGGIAALGASEFIVVWRSFGPDLDGLAIAPAVITGAIIGAAVHLAAQDLAGRSEPRSIPSP